MAVKAENITAFCPSHNPAGNELRSCVVLESTRQEIDWAAKFIKDSVASGKIVAGRNLVPQPDSAWVLPVKAILSRLVPAAV